MHRTQFSSLRRLLICTLFCMAATPAFAGKPIPPPPTPPPVHYGITWFNTAGQYEDITLYEVNGAGTTVAGSIRTGGVSKAVTIDLSTPSAPVVTDLNSQLAGVIPSGWQLTSARGVTDFGRVAGDALDESGNRVLYVYDPGDSTPFQAVGVGVPSIRYRDMNENGDVLFAEFGSSNSYLYTHDQQTIALPTALMQSAEFFVAGPASINNDRVIAGNRGGASVNTAYIHDVSANSTTNVPGYFRSAEINNEGTVVGKGSLSTGKRIPSLTAMKYGNGVKTPLISNRDSEAFDVNDSEQVVGRLYDLAPGSPNTGFLYDPNTGFWSLNNLLQENAQDTAYWYSKQGSANDIFFQDVEVEAMSEPLSGGYPLIVGRKLVPASLFPDGIERQLGFILAPISGGTSSALVAGSVPEPASFLLMAVGLFSFQSGRRRRSF